MRTAGTDGAGAAGVVVLLFTDVVGSTRLFDRLGDDATEELRRTHFSLLREAVATTGGREVKSLGDGLMVAFASPVEALRCAVEMQRAMTAHNQREPSRAIEIRIGLHLGDPPRDEDDFFGSAVVVARRLCDRAGGGQILASELLAGVAGTRGGYRFRRLGRLHLKGLAEPVAAMAVEWDTQAPSPGPPLPRPTRSPASRGPRLVGRDDELSVLRSELARASAGEFRCVLLAGDAGMGKSRLGAELLDLAGDEAVGLTARAYPFGQTASFGLWSEALERHLRHLAVHEVVDLCGGFLDDLAGLLRSVAAARGAAPDTEAPVLRLMDGLAALLSNLALADPLVIVYDDVHLADPSSWEALQYLAHTLSDTPVLVVASARPAELAEHPTAAQVVGELEQDGLLRRLTIGPVARAALAELCHNILQVPPPEPLVHWVADRSQGNPLFALGLVRALMDEGGDLAAPRLRRLPEALAERVASRLAALDTDALAAVEVLAVLARPLPLAELARIAGHSLDESAGVVHRLIRTRLVTVDEGAGDAGYEVSHPLLQEVIYDRIEPARRRALHRLAARSLLASGRFGDAAPHFARCAEVGDPEAVDALRDAFRQAEERQAYPEALGILATLVDLLPVDDPRWSEVVEAFPGGARWNLDRRIEIAAADRGLAAMRVLESVLERFPDPTRQAAVKHRLGLFLGWGIGDLPEAVRLVGEARDLYKATGDNRSTVVAGGSMAYLHSYAGAWDAMHAEAERTLREAEALGEPLLATHALAAVARTLVLAGRFDEAEAHAQRILAMARSSDDSDHLSWALTLTAISYTFGGRVREVGPLIAEAKSLSQAWRRSILVVFESGIRWMAGEVSEAVDCSERFLALHAESISPRRGIGAVFAALAALEADKPSMATDCLARAARAFGGRGWSSYHFSLHHASAVLDHRLGRTEGALDQMQRAAVQQIASGGVALAPLVLLDLAELASQEPVSPDAARAAAHHLDELAEEVNRDLYRGYAAFGRACAEVADGQPDRAHHPAEEAQTTFSALGYPILEGRSQALLGRACAPADRQSALEAFERAVATFDACGAVWRREQARGLLRALGGRGRKLAAARSGPAALTRREREVAQLAAKGHTARQIADTLVVGERTVEGHLASVYAKLGISSKVDLARRADELGL